MTPAAFRIPWTGSGAGRTPESRPTRFPIAGFEAKREPKPIR
jgi:hypothetical protein